MDVQNILSERVTDWYSEYKKVIVFLFKSSVCVCMYVYHYFFKIYL